MTYDEFTVGLKAVADALGIPGEPLRDYGWDQVVDSVRDLTAAYAKSQQTVVHMTAQAAEFADWPNLLGRL